MQGLRFHSVVATASFSIEGTLLYGIRIFMFQISYSNYIIVHETDFMFTVADIR